MRLSHGVNVNYYDREVKLPDENPTIGLLLCKSAKMTVVELTLPKDGNIHAKEPERSGDSQPEAARRASAARQYQLYLPPQGAAETEARQMERRRSKMIQPDLCTPRTKPASSP
jgi:hypothetical protein